MFKIVRSNVILWPVSIELPVDGGEMQAVESQVKFKRLPEAEYLALIEQHKPDDNAPYSMVLQSDAAVLREVVVDWPDLADEDGNPLAFSQAHLAQMLTGPDGRCISMGLFKAYNEIRFGSRQKN